MNKRLLIYCEGQSEEMIVNRLLRPHFLMHGIKVERPILAATSFHQNGQRGGFVNWDAVSFDLRTYFAADRDPLLRFTTLFDAYAMPPAVLKLAKFTTSVTQVSDIEKVEQAIEAEFGESRFKATCVGDGSQNKPGSPGSVV